MEPKPTLPEQPAHPRFDAYVGAAVLRKLGDMLSSEAPRWIHPHEPSFMSAVGVLADAKAWLEQYRTPFDDFAGDLVLLAAHYETPLAADTITTTLSSAALELVTVARLVELRDVRVDRSTTEPSRAEQTSQLGDAVDEGGDQGGS